jgi:hypothetical protein
VVTAMKTAFPDKLILQTWKLLILVP